MAGSYRYSQKSRAASTTRIIPLEAYRHIAAQMDPLLVVPRDAREPADSACTIFDAYDNLIFDMNELRGTCVMHIVVGAALCACGQARDFWLYRYARALHLGGTWV